MAQALMKDGLGEAAVARIAQALSAVSNQVDGVDFDEGAFVGEALDGLDRLELKQRVNHLIAVLARYLPADFSQCAPLLMALPAHWDRGDPDDPLRGFAAWPVTDYVGVHGLEEPELALSVLRALTGLFSAEFAIRPLLIEHPALTLATLQAWAADPDPHVRRLVSEGCRPRLPWGVRLPVFCREPQPVLALLELLKDDDSEYVRRSVANNLNDIAKDNPHLVIDICRRWHGELAGLASADQRRWIIRHGCRSLIKSGHPEVFGLLGYTATPQLAVEPLTLQQESVVIGDSQVFGFSLRSTAKTAQTLVVDYAVHHRKSNGKQQAKVFKLKNVALAPGEVMQLSKSHSFKKVTTRTYYPGAHGIEILINGVAHGRIDFQLASDK